LIQHDISKHFYIETIDIFTEGRLKAEQEAKFNAGTVLTN